MEDYIIMKTGYNTAIEESLENLKNLPNYDIIENRLKRLQTKYDLKGEYFCKISKYYDSDAKLGFIVFNDIHELKGIQILIDDKKYIELSEEEIIFILKKYKELWFEKFADKTQANAEYQKLLLKFNKIEP